MKSISWSLALWVMVSAAIAQQDSILVVGPTGLELCPEAPWVLVWGDEFDGDRLDETKWFSYFPFTADGSDSCAACRGLVGDEFLSDANLVVRNGSLFIEAKREDTTWFGRQFAYTSGNIFSKTGFRYGRFEIRCRLPKGRGFWPSFWSAGDGVPEEIDVFESKGHILRQLQTNYHHCYNRRGCQNPRWHWTPYQDDWNTYAVEWDPYYLRWYVNGKIVRVLPGYTNEQSGRTIRGCRLKEGRYRAVEKFPRHPHRIISGLGVRGVFGGRVSSKTKFPSAMEIDYIRIFQRPGQE
ncbi:MAG: glycoside hydrolase family 16 protein [Saprospiraceae bacterium]|nr:glycoside hydrolase family 16 protein [Saprospiraceae bacterium]